MLSLTIFSFSYEQVKNVLSLRYKQHYDRFEYEDVEIYFDGEELQIDDENAEHIIDIAKGRKTLTDVFIEQKG